MGSSIPRRWEGGARAAEARREGPGGGGGGARDGRRPLDARSGSGRWIPRPRLAARSPTGPARARTIDHCWRPIPAGGSDLHPVRGGRSGRVLPALFSTASRARVNEAVAGVRRGRGRAAGFVNALLRARPGDLREGGGRGRRGPAARSLRGRAHVRLTGDPPRSGRGTSQAPCRPAGHAPLDREALAGVPGTEGPGGPPAGRRPRHLAAALPAGRGAPIRLAAGGWLSRREGSRGVLLRAGAVEELRGTGRVWFIGAGPSAGARRRSSRRPGGILGDRAGRGGRPSFLAALVRREGG